MGGGEGEKEKKRVEIIRKGEQKNDFLYGTTKF